MNRKRIWTALFALYCGLMLWLLFDRPGYQEGIPYWEQLAGNLNLRPFRTLRLFGELLGDHRPHLVQIAAVNLFGNVLMFVPLGVLLPRVFPALKNLSRVLLATAAIITAVELLQLLTLVGSCDVDDLILNLLGAGWGYGINLLARE